MKNFSYTMFFTILFSFGFNIYAMNLPRKMIMVNSDNTTQSWQSVIHDENLFSYHLDQKNITAINLNTPDDQGETPLDIFWKKHPKSNDMLARLVRCGATRISINYLKEIDVVSEAKNHNYGVVKLAILHNPMLAHVQCNQKNMLNIAFENRAAANDRIDNSDEYSAYITSNTEFIRFLLQYNVTSALCGKSKKLPLHYAVLLNEVDFVELLLEHEPRIVNNTNHKKQTPLHCAVYRSSLTIIDLLIDKGAQINVQDDTGRTPLHSAVVLGNLNQIRCLLQHGADGKIVDGEGNCPIHSITTRSLNKDSHLIMHELLKYGDINLLCIKNRCGHTPLEVLQKIRTQLGKDIEPNVDRIQWCDASIGVLTEYLAQKR